MVQKKNNQERTVKLKSIAVAALMAFGVAAHAGTVTLQPSSCSSAYYCGPVANSGGESITVLVYSPHYGRVTSYINGVLWDTGLYALGSYNGAVQPTETLTSVPMYNGEGGIIHLTIEFEGGQTIGPCRQEGRVCVFPTAPVSIVSGTITGL